MLLRICIVVAMAACSGSNSNGASTTAAPKPMGQEPAVQESVETKPEACDWNQPGFENTQPAQHHEPEVEISSQGAKPRSQRAHTLAAASVFELQGRKEARGRITPPGKPGKGWTVAPPFEYRMQVKLSPAKGGAKQIDMTMLQIDAAGQMVVPPDADGQPQDLEQLTRETTADERKLVGETFSWLVAANGGPTPLTANVKRFTEPTYMLPPMPDVPLGVGAKWSITNRVSGGMDRVARFAYELTAVKDERLTIGFEISMKIERFRQILESGIPQEYSMRSLIRGQVSTDLARGPVSASWVSTAEISIRQCVNQTVNPSKLETETRWSFGIP